MELFQARGNYLYFIMFFQMRHCSDSVMSGKRLSFRLKHNSNFSCDCGILTTFLKSLFQLLSPAKKLDFQEVERVEKSACTTLGQHVDLAVRAVETKPVVASFQL